MVRNVKCSAVVAVLILLVGVLGALPAEAQLMDERVGDSVGDIDHVSMVGRNIEPVGAGLALLWDNGAYVNGIGDGCDGLDSSSLVGLDNTFGWSSLNDSFRLADDFTVPVGETWTLDEVVWRVYQTNSAPTDAITTADLRIYDGDPSLGGTDVMPPILDMPTNSSSFSGVYRDNNDAGCARAVKNVSIDATGVPPLGAGTYWVEVSTMGNAAFSGPWTPSTTPGNPASDNGLSFDETTLLYTRLADGGSGEAQDFPFQIFGSGGGGGCTPINLSVSGSCPGPITITTTGGLGTGAIMTGSGPGSQVIPGGPCVGTASGLSNLGLATTAPLNLNISVNAPAGVCGRSLQVLQVSGCCLSNVTTIP